MKYSELNNLWDKQEQLYVDWRYGLFSAANSLRQAVFDQIESPSTWSDPNTHKVHRYIELRDIAKGNSDVNLNANSEAFSDLGELFFGLSVTFDRGINTYPKSGSYVAIAVRYEKGSVQFCLWDSELQAIATGESWEDDLVIFVKRILAVFEKSLSFDPKCGFGNKPKIGFI